MASVSGEHEFGRRRGEYEMGRLDVKVSSHLGEMEVLLGVCVCVTCHVLESKRLVRAASLTVCQVAFILGRVGTGDC